MFTAERQQVILQRLTDEGRVSVGDLARWLEVSDDTIRRDLQQLAKQGLLLKTHGGAVLLDVPAMSREARQQLVPEVKTALGRAVAEQIPPGSRLMLDAGTTVLAVAQALTGPAAVLTHSLDIANVLSIKPDITLILTGGLWDPRQRLFHGQSAIETIRNFRADIAILGACALHPRCGVTATDQADAEVKRELIRSSAEQWLVLDHMKFDRVEPHAVADLTNFQRLYCDRAPAWQSFPSTLHLTTVEAA
ncbi:DeoR/GlpR family DNA-binding transcription regulator [Chitinivorax sp. B]|uniref:DeoR/GlpR family DNA-binding transcription regulator n=1 Tax=Chitinivorax sp. B TaxID=2502235 RepID=UPI0010F5D618|nr:DeoR/GlpR family DNA-binding transcription regulator [Chitinivorax sp. B]